MADRFGHHWICRPGKNPFPRCKFCGLRYLDFDFEKECDGGKK